MAGTALGALGNNGAKQQQLNKRTQKVQAAQQAMPTDSNETLDNDINHIAFEARAKQVGEARGKVRERKYILHTLLNHIIALTHKVVL